MADVLALLLFAPHLLPPGGTLQLHVGLGSQVAGVIGAGAAYDLPFTDQHDVWKFQLEGGIDVYPRDRLRGFYAGGRVLGMVWEDVPFIGGNHVGIKALAGHRWRGQTWTLGVSGGLVARFYTGKQGDGYVLYAGEWLLPTMELTVGRGVGHQ